MAHEKPLHDFAHSDNASELDSSLLDNAQPSTAAPAHGSAASASPAGGGLVDGFAFSSALPVPRLVTRGESFALNPYPGESCEVFSVGKHSKAKLVFTPVAKPDGEPLAAFTDFLNVTFEFSHSSEAMVELVRLFSQFLGEPFGSLQQRKGGLHGFTTSFAIGDTGGLFAYGGQRGKALVSLPGSACALIGDWGACYHLFAEILNARITRWDGAVDLFDGEPSVDDAVAWYQAGLFTAGGNKPSCHVNGNWIEPDGTGRTFNVGKRQNGKTLRIYEKGKQLGDASSPWVRWELELHNRDRLVPLDVILAPGKYLAAAYPCMVWVNEIQERIRTLQRTATISYQHLTHYAKQAYGPLLNVMLAVEGSPDKVIERLLRPGVPSRLDLANLPPEVLITPLVDESSTEPGNDSEPS